MKTTQQSLTGATGVAPWLNVDYYQTPPAVTLAGFVSPAAANLAWAVQYTCDPLGPEAARDVEVVQTASTTITVKDIGPPNNGGTHGLLVGDYAKLFGTGNAGVDAEFAVATVVDATHYTVVSLVNQTFSGAARVISARVFTHATLTGQATRQTGNFQFPVRACRLQLTAWVSGVAVLELIQGGLSS